MQRLLVRDPVLARAAGLAFFAPALLAGCGARSSLPVCPEPNAERSCENTCGAGLQVCADEKWGPCEVPTAARACTNACGQGMQTCQADAWSVCMVPETQRACSSACGPGQERCVDGVWQSCDAPLPAPPTFTATVRDFDDTHPDFESDGGVELDPGIVAADLGPDDKPVYAGMPTTESTHGAANFNEWYRDVPGVNETTTITLSLMAVPGDAGTYRYDNDSFFPIDGRLLGDQGRPHNFDFTLELVTEFRYTGGETLTFASDDDSWVFLNRKLAVDLGGLHPLTLGSISLDLESQRLGIVKGGTYPMHLFYAERHIPNAALRIDVPAADFGCSVSMP